MTANILVVCTHNAARSVLGEAMLNHWARRLGKDVRGFSAGSAPAGRVHPLALEVLQGAGIDPRGLRSKGWDEFGGEGAPPLAVVITVCDGAAAEPCPAFSGGAGDAPARVHWGYPDPSAAEGDDRARRRAFELTRQAIGYRMLQLVQLPLATLGKAELREALAEIGRS